MRRHRTLPILLLIAAQTLSAACSSTNGTNGRPSPGLDGGGAPRADGGGPSGTTSTPDPGPGGLYLTASGEALAVTGYEFPPSSPDQTFLVDGWTFRLDAEIVSIDHIHLWESPDMVPADQSQHGAQAAHLDGPWAIDLHKGGPLTGEGGSPEQAVPFAAIKAKDDGSAFDTTIRYAWGFDTVAASSSARNVNLSDAQKLDYEEMVAAGYSVFYIGTVSRPSDDKCVTAEGSSYDFSALPKTLKFRLGFRTPTSYVNCQNGSEFPGVKGVNGEDYARGVQFRSDRSVVGQITVHADHPFWESLAENSSLRFDGIAAQYIGVQNPVATLEDMKGVDFTAFTDKNKKPLAMRACVDKSLYSPPYPVGQQLHYGTLKVPVDKTATDPSKAIRDLYDYIGYTQSTQGHFNSQGLCFVSRNFPSPPGGS
jgi:hypothetical protein